MSGPRIGLSDTFICHPMASKNTAQPRGKGAQQGSKHSHPPFLPSPPPPRQLLGLAGGEFEGGEKGERRKPTNEDIEKTHTLVTPRGSADNFCHTPNCYYVRRGEGEGRSHLGRSRINVIEQAEMGVDIRTAARRRGR